MRQYLARVERSTGDRSIAGKEVAVEALFNKNSAWPRILAFRFARHHSSRAGRGNRVEACRKVCGIQAQLLCAAETAMRDIEFFERQPIAIRAEIEGEILALERFLGTSLKASFN